MNGFVFRGSHTVVAAKLWSKVLGKIHTGYLEEARCKKESDWSVLLTSDGKKY